MKKIVTILFSVGIIFFLSSCNKTNNNNANKPIEAIEAKEESAPVEQLVIERSPVVFIHKIVKYSGIMTKGSVDLDIDFYFTGTINWTPLDCYYLYTKYNQRIDLTSSVNDSTLTAFEKTGAVFVFNNFNMAYKQLKGTWDNSKDNTDVYSVTLERVSITDVLENAVIEYFEVEKEYYDAEIDHTKYLSFSFPRITGDYNGVNKINEHFANRERELSNDEAYNRFANYGLEAVFGNIISISGVTDGDAGGVGWGAIEGYTFDLNTGKKLSLSDIFSIDETVFMNFIYDFVSRKIIEEIRTDPDHGYFFDDSDEGVISGYIRDFSPDNFFLTEDKLIIFYQKYALKPGAYGVQIFEIPYEVIHKIKI